MGWRPPLFVLRCNCQNRTSRSETENFQRVSTLGNRCRAVHPPCKLRCNGTRSALRFFGQTAVAHHTALFAAHPTNSEGAGDGTDRKRFLTTSFHQDRQPDFSKVIPQQAYAHIPQSRQGRPTYLIEADYPTNTISAQVEAGS